MLPSIYHRVSWVRAVALAIAAAALLATPALAYTPGATGFDISYPQCGAAAPSGSFAIIGVTGGRAFSTNPCFDDEYRKALAAVGAGQVSVYMNLNAAIGSSASNGATGPRGTCPKSDKDCQAYNYGANAAEAAHTYASKSGQFSTWWLDIETANSWNAKDALNRTTIQGAVDALKKKSIQVGIYSAPYAWNSITGGWKNGMPVWFAGTSSTRCADAQANSFTNGTVLVVQTASGASNGDLAC